MAANRGLIQLSSQLARSEAMANVPNLAPLYQSSANIARQGLEMVTGVLDEIKKEEAIEEAGKKSQTNALLKDANGVYKSIYELEETLPNKVVMAIKDEIKNLQKEFEMVNTYGESDTAENNDARIRISAQLSRIKNEAVNLRKNLMLMTQDVMGDGGWDLANIRKENIDPLRSILKGDLRDMDNNNNISVKFVDGKLTFFTENYSTVTKTRPTVGFIEGSENEDGMPEIDYDSETEIEYQAQEGKMRMFNSDQMLEMLPRKNNQYLTASIKEYKTMINLGASDAIQGVYNYDDQMAVNQSNQFVGRIETKEEFQNAARANRTEGIPSLKQSLMQRVDIPLHVMNTIFVDDNGESIPVGNQLFAILNQNGDEVLDEKDYEAGLKGKNKEAFKNAYKELIKVYTDIHHDGFNLDASLVLLGQHHEAYSRQHYDEGFEAQGGKIPGKYYPEDSKNVFKFNVNQGYTMSMGDGEDKYVSGQLILTMQDFINNPKEGMTQKAYDGHVYSYKDGKFYKGENVVTQSQISKNLGMLQYGYNPKDTYSAFPDVNEEKEDVNVPLPGKDISFKNISTNTQTEFYINALNDTYKDYPVSFERAPGGAVLITADDGTQKSISTVNKLGFGREEKARKEIQAFVAKQGLKTK